jgi:hypothetical protein
MSFSSFSKFQNAAVSEKIGLCIVEASKRLMGWALHSGSIYKLTSFEHSVVMSITDSGTAYASVGSIAACTAGKYYLDRQNRTLYLRASDSSNPNSRFLACVFRLFFATAPVRLPWDLGTGFDVEWLPMLLSNSKFGVGIDNQNQVGVAIEGSGDIQFVNQLSYWQPRFDKFYFENQNVLLYTWNRELLPSQALLIYHGRIQGKTWTDKDVKFQVKDLISELRNPVPLTTLGTIVGARIPDNMSIARKRRIYGKLAGFRPTNIDQVLSGYPLTGTISILAGGTTATGTGTSFLTQLMPGDTLSFDGSTATATVKAVNSATSIDLADAFSGSQLVSVNFYVTPARAKRYTNRNFIVSGHALSEPVPTVTRLAGLAYIEVSSNRDIEEGDLLYINGEVTSVKRTASGNAILLNTNLQTPATVGTVVKRPAIWNVYLNDRLLTVTRDYTYSAALGTLTLTQLAEFNIAPSMLVAGTFAFVNGSRSVAGSGAAAFQSTIKPGDWIKAHAQADWFEVLSVDSDTALTLVSAATYSATSSADLKSPDYYEEDSVILSCSVFGATDDGTTTGALLGNGPQIVQDLLQQIGLTSMLNTASFATSAQVAEHRLGFAIPETYSDTEATPTRDVINKVNESVLGALIQTASFQLAYSILRPKRGTTAKVLREFDILKMTVQTKSDQIIKQVNVEYGAKEYDKDLGKANVSAISAINKSAQYLALTTKEQAVSTYLINERTAQIHAYRWAFLFSSASAAIQIETKLQGIDLSVTDAVEIYHEKIYQRIASTMNRKVGQVQSLERSVGGTELAVNDLGNAFSRCGAISANDAKLYSAAPESERALNGYITDTYGMIGNDPATFGINLIW